VLRISLLLLLCGTSLQECDPKTCEYCCVSDPPGSEKVCKNIIHICRLSNPSKFGPVIVLIIIIGFWCCLIPLCLNTCKIILTKQFCFGHTIFGGLEKMLKLMFSRTKKSTIVSRDEKDALEKAKSLRKNF